MRGHQDVLIYLRRHNLKMFIVATSAKGTCQKGLANRLRLYLIIRGLLTRGLEKSTFGQKSTNGSPPVLSKTGKWIPVSPDMKAG